MQLYGLKNCDTCRKALKVLPHAEFVDVRGEGVPDAVLSDAFATFGETLLNTRSTTWRGLSDEDRNEAPLTLLRKHPTLMKRPLIVDEQKMYLGWTDEVRNGLGVA